MIDQVVKVGTRITRLGPCGVGKDPGAEVKAADAKAVSTQDDSQGRPVTLRVIVVNKANTTTTLVISRANGEKETHIAWLHYLWLEGKRILSARS